MANRSVVINLGMNIGGVIAGARTASKALADMGGKGLDWVGKREQSINTLTTGIGAVGLAAVAGAGLAVRAFANFDEAMSHVAATGDDARGSLDQLRQAALDAGAETAFSATEAAGAIEELAKAGVSAEDILAGGLDGALDLAAAGGIEVAQAAEIAASAMTQFGLAGDDVVHVADLLAAGAGKAQGGVHELGMALNQAGLVADQTGLSIEETTGGLAAFASAGLLGSDAGTSFKTMLQRLTPTSVEAADEMERLGISAYDGQGQFIGLAEFAGNLQAALRDLTPEQRNAAMATIFGSDAVRAASILYEQGEPGIRNWIAAVDDQGYAAETAATRMDNLKGDLEEFGGALETALIGAGSGADGPLRDLVQGATDAVNAFNDLPPGVQSATLAIVGGGGLVALGVAGLGKLAVGVANTREAINDLGLTSGRAGRTLRFAGAVGAIGAVGFAVWELNKALNQTEISSQAAYEGVLALSRGESSAALNELIDSQVRLREAAEPIADTSLWGRIKNGVSNLAGGDQIANLYELGGASEEFSSGLQLIDAELAKLASGGDIEGATAAFDELADRLGYQGDEVDRLREKLPAYQEALRGTAEDQALAAHEATAAGGAVAGMGEEFAGGTAEIDAQTEALSAWLDQIKIATDPVFALNDAVVGVTDAQTAYNEAVAEFGPTSAEAQQAGLDLAGAVANLESAALSGDLSFDAFASKLDQWVAQGAITADQADTIRDRVAALTGVAEDYEDTYTAQIDEDGAATAQANANRALGVVDAFGRRNVIAHLRAQANTSRAEGELNSLTRARTVNIYPKVVGGPLPKARGGPVQMGQLYTVGEEGPELFVPEGDGEIIPAGRTRSILSSLNQRSGLESMGALTALGVAEYRLGDGLWRAIDSATDMVEEGGVEVEDSLIELDSAITRAAQAYDRVARSVVPAPIGIKPPDRPSGKEPLSLTPLQTAAKELLDRIRSGGKFYEDFSFEGMSDLLRKYNDQLAAMYTGPNAGSAIEAWLIQFLGGKKAKGGGSLWMGEGRAPEMPKWFTTLPLHSQSDARSVVDADAIAAAVAAAMPTLDGATLQLQIGSESVLARVVDKGARVNARRA
ncbi:phage tail tape measure protein [Jiangella asiatica]|uniref:Phage tail tape measure protein n=1 Tax=Jiangella asiatica TaxID=2530372 RepID=A0A4R5CTT5_9ACTN|nr:phage tail tape measure protein [Jiangella asiatica]TDE02830.1 phage tail tape measure protein [Jiangella asiatica]